MLSPVAAGHRMSMAFMIEWLLVIAVALTGALMVMIGMIEELPIILRSTLNRLFNKERT
jgi:hypothetical protein